MPTKKTIKASFSDAEFVRVADEAKLAQLPVAAWLRRLALESIGLPYSPLPRGYAARPELASDHAGKRWAKKTSENS